MRMELMKDKVSLDSPEDFEEEQKKAIKKLSKKGKKVIDKIFEDKYGGK